MAAAGRAAAVVRAAAAVVPAPAGRARSADLHHPVALRLSGALDAARCGRRSATWWPGTRPCARSSRDAGRAAPAGAGRGGGPAAADGAGDRRGRLCRGAAGRGRAGLRPARPSRRCGRSCSRSAVSGSRRRASTCCCCCCTTSRATAGRWRRWCAIWRAPMRRAPAGRRRTAGRAAGAVRRLHAVAARRCSARRATRQSRSRASSSTGARAAGAAGAARAADRPAAAGGAEHRGGTRAAAARRRAARAAAGAGAAERRDPVHGAAGGAGGAADPARRGHDIPIGTPVAGRTDEALDGAGRVLRQHPGAAHRHVGRPELPRAAGAGPRRRLAAYAHQDVPFERLVEVLNPARSLRGTRCSR